MSVIHDEFQRDRFRRILMGQLLSVMPQPVRLDALVGDMTAAGFRGCTLHDVQLEAEGLRQLGFVKVQPVKSNKAVMEARLTEKGRVYLASGT